VLPLSLAQAALLYLSLITKLLRFLLLLMVASLHYPAIMSSHQWQGSRMLPRVIG
jgi:hypothetical protein